MTESDDITRLLRRAAQGDRVAAEELSARVYDDLERVAAKQMRERYGFELAGATLEPSVLVNETLLKLIQGSKEFENRRHFYSFATKVMSRILLDYERKKSTEKRGGGLLKVTLSSVGREDHAVLFSELSEAFDQLAELDERKAEVVNLKVFFGLENAEIAETLGVSLATIERDWRFARSWLRARFER